MKDCIRFNSRVTIGNLYVSILLSRVNIFEDRINITTGLPKKNISFFHNQINSINTFINIPFISWGLIIYHNREDIPERIVIWTPKNPHSYIKDFSNKGFVVSSKK